MNEIANEILTDGIGQVYYLLPIPFIAMVLGISIWLDFTSLNGKTKKWYKLYNAISAILLAITAHFTIPVDDRKVNDIPTLLISIITSGVVIQFFVYWRRKKNS